MTHVHVNTNVCYIPNSRFCLHKVQQGVFIATQRYAALRVHKDSILSVCDAVLINPLAPELFFLILAHPVYKM